MAEIDQGRDSVLTSNHVIRELERDLRVARRRRGLSNLFVVLGVVFFVGLYSLLWIQWVPGGVKLAIYLPSVPTMVAFVIASYVFKRYPGGPVRKENGAEFRVSEGDLELELARERESRKHLLASADTDSKVRRVSYKEDAYKDIEELRRESKRYRRVNNILQGVLIIGSLAATGAAGVAGELPYVRWVILAVTFVVGISSGFMGYFKYKERSFYLQQTADAIEQEWEAVEVGVGRYKKSVQEGKEEEALADFVEEVHRLKSEQRKRQQNLEQPPEARVVDE